MNNIAVTLLHNLIPDEALLAETHVQQKECLSAPTIAAFAILVCAALKTHQYSASTAESYKRAVESSLARWKDQLSAMER